MQISKELLQEILDYLQRRPYNEVFPLIHKILNEVQSTDGLRPEVNDKEE